MPLGQAAWSDVDADFSEEDFRMVADLVRREAGIVVLDHKLAMVRGRLVRRARELGLASLHDYCTKLRAPGRDNELPGLLNALTTNHTAFYREAHHFEHLEHEALPALLGDEASAGRLRIWCAAASTGEEPVTIAATLKAATIGRPHPDCLILATDLDSEVLATASEGVYPEETVAKLDERQRERLRFAPAGYGRVRVDRSLTDMIRYRRMNILHEWPFSGLFQIIFCRNMLIYFDQPTKTRVIRRLAAKLAPGGYLYLGHSEAFAGAVGDLRLCGRTTYRRS